MHNFTVFQEWFLKYITPTFLSEMLQASAVVEDTMTITQCSEDSKETFLACL